MSGARIGITLLFLGIVVGCSEAGFHAVPSKTCTSFNNGSDQNCTFNPNGNEYSVSFKTGQIDILIINDNSRSMSAEQQKMANAFSGFLNTLGGLDYRIAMITTDVAKSQGQLLDFGSGERFLTPSSTNLINKFTQTVVRQETINCDTKNSSCPSDDERGIYAANLAINRNEGGWLRPGAHLAIVALADEDQRSGTVFNSTTGQWESINQKFGDVLESKDFPQTLVTDFSNMYASKSLSVHSVIVIPGDSTCLNQQTVYVPSTGHYMKGSYGNFYQQLSQASQNQLTQYGAIVNGSVSSICNSNYYSDLNLIGSLVSANADQHTIQMQCLPDLNDIVIDASQSIDYYVDSANKKIIFQNLPFGVQVTAKWTCPNSI